MEMRHQENRMNLIRAVGRGEISREAAQKETGIILRGTPRYPDKNREDSLFLMFDE